MSSNKKRMSKLKFKISEYKKYNTKRVAIFYACFKLDEDCEVLEVNDTDYDYKKAVIKLSSEKADIMNYLETEVNDYLEENNIPIITIVYGNRVYPKVKSSLPIKDMKTIKLKGVFVNDENKSFPQLWIEQL